MLRTPASESPKCLTLPWVIRSFTVPATFDRHVRVDAVLIENIDDITLETLERRVCDLLDVLWPTIHAEHIVHFQLACFRIDVVAELGGDHHLTANGRERLTHELLVGEWTIDFSCVEECHTTIDRCSNERDHFSLFAAGP